MMLKYVFLANLYFIKLRLKFFDEHRYQLTINDGHCRYNTPHTVTYLHTKQNNCKRSTTPAVLS